MAGERRKREFKTAPAGSRFAPVPTAGRRTPAQPGSRGPQPMANVLAELMARSGLGRVQSAAALQEAWHKAAGPVAARYTRPGALRRGKLEVIVANSTIMQELNYQKQTIVEALVRLLPDQAIKDVRFRLGAIE